MVHNSLKLNAWLHPPPYRTILPFTWDLGCSHLGRAEKENFGISTNTDISILSGFTLGICISLSQTFCNDMLANASEAFFNSFRMETKTFKVILLHYVLIEMGQLGSVFAVVSNLNILNTEGETTTNTNNDIPSQNITTVTAVTVTSGHSSLSGRGMLEILSVNLITLTCNV